LFGLRLLLPLLLLCRLFALLLLCTGCPTHHTRLLHLPLLLLWVTGRPTQHLQLVQ
jgi:hypothetical protein